MNIGSAGLCLTGRVGFLEIFPVSVGWLVFHEDDCCLVCRVGAGVVDCHGGEWSGCFPGVFHGTWARCYFSCRQKTGNCLVVLEGLAPVGEGAWLGGGCSKGFFWTVFLVWGCF